MRESTWVTDGTVNAIANTGSTVFIGGTFSHVGAWTGSAVTFDRATGQVQRPYPRVSGTVFSVIADGTGGWFLGGSFAAVQGQVRANVAHVLADGSLAAWGPSTNAPVRALVLSGTTLYMAGDFTIVQGSPRNHLAALDANSAALSAWNPGTDGSATALVLSGNLLIAGGQFRFAGGRLVAGIAAFDLPSGNLSAIQPNGPDSRFEGPALCASNGLLYVGKSLVTTYIGPPTGTAAALDPGTGVAQPPFLGVSGVVRAIASDGAGGWYLGGLFNAVRGRARQNLAHVLSDGTVAAWNPRTNDSVLVLAVRNDTVWAGGNFKTCGGKPRGRLAAIDAASGAALGWNANIVGPNLDTQGAVSALQLDGGRLFVGGNFISVGGASHQNLAVVRTTDGGLDANQPPSTSGPVRTLALAGGVLVVGGAFDLAGGLARHNIFALVAGSGAPIAFDPNANGPVDAVAVSGTTVYMGGEFTGIGGAVRNRLAAQDLNTGTLPWTADANDIVRGLAIVGATVYAGGDFLTVSGTARSHLAALDAATAAVQPWDPEAAGLVYTVGTDGATVTVGGSFVGVGGRTAGLVTAVDLTTGQTVLWRTSPLGTVRTLLRSGNAVYAGGSFQITGRDYAAAFDATSGSLLPWNPSLVINAYPGDLNALACTGDTIYLGGGFSTVNGQARAHVAAVDTTTGALRAWTADVDSTVYSLGLSGGKLEVAGEFGSTRSEFLPRANFAAFDAVTGEPRAWQLSSNGAVRALALDGPRLLAGGNFTILNGVLQERFSVLDTATAAVLSPDVPFTGAPYAILPAGGRIYVGGGFDDVAGVPRTGLAALDRSSLALLPWNPNPAVAGTVFEALVTSLAFSGSAIYAGGSFTAVGGATRRSLAAIDTTTGLATSWDPDLNGTVQAVTIGSGSLYAGGDFTTVGGTSRSRIAAIDLSTGTATAWNPGADNTVNVLAYSNGIVFAGGAFTGLGGQPRLRLGALDATSGAPLNWTPTADGLASPTNPPSVTALSLMNGTLFVGGGFGRFEGQPRRGLAALADPWFNPVLDATPRPDAPQRFALAQNTPNPFRGTSAIPFTLPRAGSVWLSLLDPAGRVVRTLLDGVVLAAGPHTVPLGAAGLAPGLYWYRLQWEGESLARRMVAVP